MKAADGKVARDRATRRPALAAGLFFAALVILFFAPTFGRDFIFRDAYHEFYPMMLLWGWTRGLTPPLWNPYINLGAPMAGSVFQALFYPVQFLLLDVLRLPPSLVMNLFIYFHYWLAAMGMWALLRALGGRTAGPLAGAVSYAFGGYLVSMSYARNLLPGFGLAPLALALLLRARREGRPGLAAAAGLCLGLIFLGGDPQVFAVTFVAGPAVALLLVPRGETAGAGWLRAAATPALFWLVAILAASAELLPALFNFALLGRSGGFGDQALTWSFHPARIVEFFSAGLFGRAWPLNQYWGRFAAGAGFPLPMALSCYLGAWTVIAAVAAAGFAPLRRQTRVLGAIVALALLLALGGHTPLYPFLLDHLPGFGLFRYPEKYLLWLCLGTAALAGAGTDAIDEDPRAWRIAFLAALAFALAFGFVAAMAWAGEEALARGLGPLLPEPFDPAPAAAAHAVVAALARAAALFGFSGAALYLLGREHERPWAFLIPALFLFADLLSTGRPLLMAEHDFYSAPSRFAAIIAAREKVLAHDGPCRFAGGRPCLAPGRFRIFRDNSISAPPSVLVSVNGRQAIDQVKLRRWERDTLKPNLAVMDGIEDFAGMNVASSAAFDALMIHTSLDQLPRFNVKYAVIPTAAEDPHGNYQVLDRDGGASLVELTDWWPRAYFVPSGAIVGRRESSSPMMPPAEARWALPPATPPPAARILEYTPNRVSLELDAPETGSVVLNDAFSPGWFCPTNPILRFEKLVRAVVVPAGRQRIEFTYRPPLFDLGLLLSGFGLAAGLAGIFLHRR